MKISEALNLLKKYKIESSYSDENIKPRLVKLVYKNKLLHFIKYYAQDSEISENLLREIGEAFELPNNWWNKTP